MAFHRWRLEALVGRAWCSWPASTLSRSAGTGLLVALLHILSGSPLSAQARSGVGVAVVPLVGGGRFPRPRVPVSGVNHADLLIAGLGAELDWRSITVLASVAKSHQPFLCGDICPPGGKIAEFTALWRVVSAIEGRGAVSVGGTMGRSTFDGDRGSVGIAASAGVTRGIGPRFLVRYAWMSGPGSPETYSAWFGLRIGS